MNEDKLPFYPPYFTTGHTGHDLRFTEVLADGTARAASAEDSRRLQGIYSPSKPAYPSTRPEKSATVVLKPVPTVLGQSGSVTLLNVPFAHKEDAKAAGARWDSEKKKWYVPGGADVELFKRWWA